MNSTVRNYFIMIGVMCLLFAIMFYYWFYVESGLFSYVLLFVMACTVAAMSYVSYKIFFYWDMTDQQVDDYNKKNA